MKPSRLVTPAACDVTPFVASKKITKAALAGGAAALAVAGAVGVAAPAQAGTAHITTVVTWTGPDNWLEITYPNGNWIQYGHFAATQDYASSGQLVGVDPIMGNADRITCSLFVNNQLVVSDSANAGDGTDANCLRTLR